MPVFPLNPNPVPTIMDSFGAMDGLSLLRLLQMSSPSLPVGAYAYSQGLEYAVQRGWVHDEHSAAAWIRGVLEHNIGYWDVPLGYRLYQGWARDDGDALNRWNEMLFASRESGQIQAQERHLAVALEKVLAQLNVGDWWLKVRDPRCYLSIYMGVFVHWRVDFESAVCGLLWSTLENLTLAAIKLVPLGQSAGQRILHGGAPLLVCIAENGRNLADDEMGQAMPGYQMAVSLHETMYSRLFRS